MSTDGLRAYGIELGCDAWIEIKPYLQVLFGLRRDNKTADILKGHILEVVRVKCSIQGPGCIG